MPADPAHFRDVALSLPDTEEGAHGGHPDFRTAGRVFATLHADDVTAMVRVPPDVQKALIERHGDAFWPATGAWGRAGCTLLDLRRVARDVIEHALHDAWTFAHTSPRRAAAKAKATAKAKAKAKK